MYSEYKLRATTQGPVAEPLHLHTATEGKCFLNGQLGPMLNQLANSSVQIGFYELRTKNQHTQRLDIVPPTNHGHVIRYSTACRPLINRALRLLLGYMYRPVQQVGVRVVDKGTELTYRTVTSETIQRVSFTFNMYCAFGDHQDASGYLLTNVAGKLRCGNHVTWPSP